MAGKYTLVRRYLFCIALIVSGNKSYADKKLMQIEGSKRNITLLNQSLEFDIKDDKSIQVGNFLFNGSEFLIQFDKESKSFSVTAPMRYLKNATISLKNPVGIGIWKRQILPESSGLSEINPMDSHNILAVYQSSDEFDLILEKASQFLFVNFCLSYSEDDFYYEIYNQKLQIKKANDGWQIQKLNNQSTESIVQVNSEELGSNGEIQISKSLKSLSFSAKLESGFRIDLFTRARQFTVQNAFMLPDQKLYLEINNGAKKSFSVVVDQDKNFFNLEGDNLIPLKQRFKINGLVPSDGVIPNIQNEPGFLLNQMDDHYAILGRDISLNLKIADSNQNLTALTASDQIFKNNDNDYIWRLKNKNYNSIKKHELKLQTSSGSFSAHLNLKSWPASKVSLLLSSESAQSMGENNSGQVLQLNWSRQVQNLKLLGATELAQRLHFGIGYAVAKYKFFEITDWIAEMRWQFVPGIWQLTSSWFADFLLINRSLKWSQEKSIQNSSQPSAFVNSAAGFDLGYHWIHNLKTTKRTYGIDSSFAYFAQLESFGITIRPFINLSAHLQFELMLSWSQQDNYLNIINQDQIKLKTEKSGVGLNYFF